MKTFTRKRIQSSLYRKHFGAFRHSKFNWIFRKEGFEKIKIIDVCDDWLEKRILKTKLKVEIIENPSFINSKEDLKVYFEGKSIIIKPIFTSNSAFLETFF